MGPTATEAILQAASAPLLALDRLLALVHKLVPRDSLPCEPASLVALSSPKPSTLIILLGLCMGKPFMLPNEAC